MNYTMSVSYLPCQTCKARVHCAECELQLEHALMRISGIAGARLQLARRELLIEADCPADEIADLLEDLGLFPE